MEPLFIILEVTAKLKAYATPTQKLQNYFLV